MDCVNCGGGGFNRVVVDPTSGVELGSICADCEGETFGVTLRNPELRRSSGCNFCRGDGHYALPRLECVVEWDDGTGTEREYAIDDRTPRLCDLHLSSLFRFDPAVAARTARSG